MSYLDYDSAPTFATGGYITKDSGERAEFSSGMVRDTNADKPRFDLMIAHDVPYEHQMLTRLAKLYMRGAQKYNARNHELGRGPDELARAKESTFRHFMQWFCGETDEDHAAAVIWGVGSFESMKWRSENDPVRIPGLYPPDKI